MEAFSTVNQNEEIQKEIEARQPMFTSILDFSSLSEEYSSNAPFQAKIPVNDM